MRISSTTNTQHPTPKHKTCSLGCALHQHLTINTQHPNANMFPQMRTSSTPNNKHPTPKDKHVPSNAHFFNTKHSTPNAQANIYTSSSPNIQHLTPIFNTQHPTQAPNTLLSNNLHQSASTIGLLPRGKV